MSRGTQRKLAAIVSADVVGYSRLMGVDETGTLQRLKAHRANLIDKLIETHGGRIVKTTGDGLLLEFPSVVAAVECVVAVQEGMIERNADVSQDEAIRFRIGVHLGDVIVEGDDIFGEGVNIAARLQEIGEADGVTISSNAHDSVDRRIKAGFVDGGDQELKNIARPVRVWQWSSNAKKTAAPSDAKPSPAPDKPSIAVLPFNNMSGDPEQEFFADGMAEDIITGLSQFGSLLVIARNSTFSFKGQSIDVKQVAETLAVRYVLEGSIRKGGDRIRVTAQLIDADSGNHIWAERFDRDVSDIFAVQDEVTGAIIAAIAPEIDQFEIDRSRRKSPAEFSAWDLYQKGLAAYHSSEPADFISSIDTFDQATQLDPEFALAWAMGALARTQYALNGQPEDRDGLIREARDKVQTALRLSPRDPLCVLADGTVHSYDREHQIGIAKLQDAIKLNPNLALAYLLLGQARDAAGQYENVIAATDEFIRLSPRDVDIGMVLTMRAYALLHLHRYDEAVETAYRSMHTPNPTSWAFVCYCVCLFHHGRREEAQLALDDVYAQIPDFSQAHVREALRHHDQENISMEIDALRELGVPD